MRKNLLEFLFGPTAVLESSKSLGEDVVKLFEDNGKFFPKWFRDAFKFY